MSHYWEQQLHEIREQVLMMSGLAERNLAMAMKALIERDDAQSAAVEAEDNEVDQLEVHVDELVVTYLSTRGAAASDARLLLTASRISSNLERIADEATTIARRARVLNKEPLLKAMIDIPIMADTARSMLRESITAFVQEQPDLALEIVGRDKGVDEIYKQLVRELTTYMMEDPKTISRALNLMTVAKALERVADHAANIAEDVYYLFKGQDIRHRAEVKGRQSKE